ncbi:MAG: hypothetical protein Ta2G_17260 [Termitinemataceae bacterium]|nr:MAG: hypothetical protein Ta2G_17260 [Termitinemataceae bacterium]
MKFTRVQIIFVILLFFSCEKPFEEIHGRIIPKYDKYFFIEDIDNKEHKIDRNKYDIKQILSDDGKYIAKIYTNKKILLLEKYTDEYYNIAYRNEWYSILDIIRTNDNKEIIYGFPINPDDKIIFHKNKLYCHSGNLVYELDLIKFKQRAIYIYDKITEIELLEVIDNKLLVYLLVYIEEIDLENRKIIKNKNKIFRIKI